MMVLLFIISILVNIILSYLVYRVSCEFTMRNVKITDEKLDIVADAIRNLNSKTK